MLTSEQVRGLTQLAPSTFDRWLKKYRSQLGPSYVLGSKEPRYSYAAVRGVLSGEKQPDLIALPDLRTAPGNRRRTGTR